MFEYRATIERWIDGDTFVATIDLGFRISQTNTFRLYGANTPERGQPSFFAATEFAKGFTSTESPVLVKTHKDKTGKFGRYLAEVWVDGRSLASELIDLGLAEPYFGGKRE